MHVWVNWVKMLTDAVGWQVLMNKVNEGVFYIFHATAHTMDFCRIS